MMDKKLQSFLNSGILDRYITGMANESEKAEAEYFIENFTAIKKEYLNLQNQLKSNDALKSQQAPANLLNGILKQIEPSPQLTQKPYLPKRNDRYNITCC